MYDFAFDKTTLRAAFIARDFEQNPTLAAPAISDQIILDALQKTVAGFGPIAFKSAIVRKNRLYQFNDLSDEIVVRKLARNIRRLTRVKQSDRETIIRSIRLLLEEGHDYRVYRLDIRRFYESISCSAVTSALSRDLGFPPASLKIWNSFDAQLSAQAIDGMPRGIAISATIAEYVMRNFDRQLKMREQVYFYARYVDDIVILTKAKEDAAMFREEIEKHLPVGLSLNFKKCKTFTFSTAPLAKASPFAIEHKFDFLGYQFTVSKPRNPKDSSREVRLDISPAKATRFKTRMTLALRQFSKDLDFGDFVARINLLAGNYNVYDRSSGHRRNVGIYFNYNLADFATSEALQDLDRFWKRLVLAKSGKQAAALAGKLSKQQRNTLLSKSFVRAFELKTFFDYRLPEVSRLTRCWAYA